MNNQVQGNTRVVGFAQTLQVQLALNSSREAIMEVQRAYFEQENLLSLNHWLAEWTAREAAFRQLQHTIASNVAHSVGQFVVDSEKFVELESALSSLQEAFAAFMHAYDQKNHALFVRWMDEWKARRAKWDQLAQDWLREQAQPSLSS